MSVTKKERARVRRVKQRLKKRRGNVIFIESAPEGMKEWLQARAAKKGTSMAGEAVAIIESARARSA